MSPPTPPGAPSTAAPPSEPAAPTRKLSANTTSTFSSHASSAAVEDQKPLGSSSSDTIEDEVLPKRRLCGLLPPKVILAAKLKPDPSPEQMLPFSTKLTPSQLYALIDPKSVEHFTELGGIDGLIEGLKTDGKAGLSDNTSGAIALDERLRVYGENRVPGRPGVGLLKLMWFAYQDKVLLILSVAAVISLALGLYQDLGTPPSTVFGENCPNQLCPLPQLDFVEGVAIFLAIIIVVMVGALNDYQKERQFTKLNAKKEERDVKALRDGKERLLSIYSILVGDVLFLEPGDVVAADGVFLQGHNVRCDESGATGESDAVRKAPYNELLGDDVGEHVDCFLISGSTVIEGVGTYLVTAVGEHSFHGKIMMSLRTEAASTPLQLKLENLAEYIAKFAAAAGGTLFAALLIRYLVGIGTINSNQSADEKAQGFIQILILAVTIIVVAVPEGLPLAVTLALAFATRRMMKMGLLVRVLGACETMGSATVICTDKTGTLTQNKMVVVAGSIGVNLKFADKLAENALRSNANETEDGEKAAQEHAAGNTPGESRLDFSTEMTAINHHISVPLQNLLNDSIAINSTAFESTNDEGITEFIGSKTETALLDFAALQGWKAFDDCRSEAKIVQMISFSSEKKFMGAIIELPGGGFRALLKGASEVLAKKSTRHVVVVEGEDPEVKAVPTSEFYAATRDNIDRTIMFYANQSLRTIALCSRDFTEWPPAGATFDEAGDVDYTFIAQDLTLVAITAIEDPLRDGVTTAVATCQMAGVAVKMCTGDNILTARSIATQCGIYSAGGIIMEGPTFRKLTFEERQRVVPRLQVLARSSPEDKKILVEHLQSMGEIVGVTGDGTNDGPALKTANVGFSMGIAGTEVAKEASDIILMDDNFSSIVDAIMWGRCVNDSVKKFLQFQITVSISAVIITFVTGLSSDNQVSALKAIQLLWINLIINTMAALALSTDPADPQNLKRDPDRSTVPLISPQMWLMMVIQAIFQVIVALVLYFAGASILGLSTTDPVVQLEIDEEITTLVFNTFVFSQIFNQLNARRLDRGFNVFRGFTKNVYVMAIFIAMVVGQFVIVEYAGIVFETVPLGGAEWGISIVIGFLSLPLGVVVRLLPPEPWERLLIRLKLYPDPNAPDPIDEEVPEEWNDGIGKVIHNLTTLAEIRAGQRIEPRSRMSLMFQTRKQRMKKHDIRPSALMAMVPSLVMGSIGAGWRPKGTLSDPASFAPTQSSVRLYEGRAVQHPQTDGSVDDGSLPNTIVEDHEGEVEAEVAHEKQM